VRQFTFLYPHQELLEIVKEVEEKDPIPPRDRFIDALKVSPELRSWLKGHDTLDFTEPGFDKLLTPDDVLNVPEFLLAYQRTNSGGRDQRPAEAKYTDADKTDHPEKYEKLKQDYLASLKKFLRSRPETMSGGRTRTGRRQPAAQVGRAPERSPQTRPACRPGRGPAQISRRQGGHRSRGARLIVWRCPGDYWISSLNLDADAGDMRVRWDVPVKIDRGKTIRVELSNLNSIDARSSTP